MAKAKSTINDQQEQQSRTGAKQPGQPTRRGPKTARKRSRDDSEDESEISASQSTESHSDATQTQQVESGDAPRPKRPRGRPRKDPDDNDERHIKRRNQIRVAQRKYRKRQADDLSGQKLQVEKLVEEKLKMADEISSFLQFAQANGSLQLGNPELSKRLEAMTKNFPDIVNPFATADRQVTEPAMTTDRSLLADSEGIVTDTSSQATTYNNWSAPVPILPTGPPAEPIPIPVSAPGSEHGSRRFPILAPAPAPTSSQDTPISQAIGQAPTLLSAPASTYISPQSQQDFAQNNQVEIGTEPSFNNAVFPTTNSGSTMDAVGNRQLPDLGSRLLSQPGPQAPDSYASRELTFGRRLQRFTLQRALTLLQAPCPPPDRFTAVFGFCLLFESSQGITDRLLERLNAMNTETLNHWRAPFTNLGGAGWHYSEDELSLSSGSPDSLTGMPIGNQGTVQTYKPQHATGYSMGPFTPQVESVKQDLVDKRMHMNFPGFQGEFLDADEVEIYLRKRGVHIPPYADVVEVNINALDFNGGAHLYAHNAGNPPPEQVPPQPFVNPDSFNPQFPFSNPEVPAEFWFGRTPNQAKLMIDVNVLEYELCSNAVCLGRTPGIRPKDVDRALKLATGLAIPSAA